jgi:hypothetical protein
MLEAVIVTLIVGVAAVFVVRFLYREWKGTDAGCDCKASGCADSCASSETCVEVFTDDLMKRAAKAHKENPISPQ